MPDVDARHLTTRRGTFVKMIKGMHYDPATAKELGGFRSHNWNGQDLRTRYLCTSIMSREIEQHIRDEGS